MSARGVTRLRSVVVQVADGDVEAAARQIGNLLDAAQGAEIEVVAHGQGIELVVAGNTAETAVQELLTRNVTVVACRNTLHRMGIDAADLIDGVGTVPAGLAEIVQRQWEGAACVRV